MNKIINGLTTARNAHQNAGSPFADGFSKLIQMVERGNLYGAKMACQAVIDSGADEARIAPAKEALELMEATQTTELLRNSVGTPYTCQAVEDFQRTYIDPCKNERMLQHARHKLNIGSTYLRFDHPFEHGSPEYFAIHRLLKAKALTVADPERNITGWEWNSTGKGCYSPIFGKK